jgi:hypothetical protein
VANENGKSKGKDIGKGKGNVGGRVIGEGRVKVSIGVPMNIW